MRQPRRAPLASLRIIGPVFLAACTALPLAARAEGAIDIGLRLEPLVDDYLIDSMEGASLALHKPIAREVAIVHDAPWEGDVCAYHTVFRDGPIVRMYYRGASSVPGPDGKVHEQVVCYAESRDGIHFTKPKLGLFEFNGSKANNIVWAGKGAHNFSPMRDSNPACEPDARYKALGSGPGGLYPFRSADGVRWAPMSDKPVVTKGAFDSQNLAFWDAVRGRYVEYHRGFRDKVRDIMTSTSTDFFHWTEPAWLAYPGAPKEHLYTNQIIPYERAPHIFVGFPKRFLPDRNPMKNARGGVSDGLLMTSRDGVSFHRWGEAIIRPGLQKERWVCRNNLTAWGIVTTPSDIPGTPDELSIYSTENYYQKGAVRLRRFTWRTDGFVSVAAPLAGGQFTTKPILFGRTGKEIVLNYSTSAAGSVRGEIQDASGKPMAGFSLADCDELFGDQLDRPLSWKGRTDLSALTGIPIRLHFTLKDADLYAIQFRP